MKSFTKKIFLGLVIFILTCNFIFSEDKYNFWNRIKVENQENVEEENATITEETTDIEEIASTENEEKKDKPKREGLNFWNRIFEIGIDADVGVSNSYFNASDLLKEEVVIDFNKITDDLGDYGLSLNAVSDVSLFANVNLALFEAGILAKVDLTTNVQIENSLLDLVANGNTLNENFGAGLGIGASLFSEIGAHYGMKIGKIKFNASPLLYAPLFYLPYTSCSVTSVVNDDGSIVATGGAEAKIYSALNLRDLANINTADIFSQSGLDINAVATYELFSFLDVGVSLTHIPIVPATVKCTNKYNASMNFEMGNLLGNLSGENSTGDLVDLDYDFAEGDVTDNDSVILVRPFKIGFLAEWRVFNNRILIVSPLIQFKFADFTLDNVVGFGFDYAISAKSDMGFFIPEFTTSYMDSIFRQKLTLALNLRFVELDLVLSTQSANLWKSFTGSGFGAGVGLKIGL